MFYVPSFWSFFCADFHGIFNNPQKIVEQLAPGHFCPINIESQKCHLMKCRDIQYSESEPKVAPSCYTCKAWTSPHIKLIAGQFCYNYYNISIFIKLLKKFFYQNYHFGRFWPNVPKNVHFGLKSQFCQKKINLSPKWFTPPNFFFLIPKIFFPKNLAWSWMVLVYCSSRRLFVFYLKLPFEPAFFFVTNTDPVLFLKFAMNLW